MAYALITGASGGIGRELAALFARDGFGLVLTARNEGRLNELKNTLEQHFDVPVTIIPLDLGAEGAARVLVDEVTAKGIEIEVLVNNAGFAEWSGFLDSDWERQHELMQVNMIALAELAYRFGRDMRTRGRGRILNISSVASMMAGPWMASYFASKAFVRSLSEALAHELHDSGVTVTCVCPGPTRTGFERAAHMSGRNFFTMTRPADAQRLAAFAYRRTMAGRALAYHGTLTKAGALGEHILPRAASRRIAAFMNGGDPARTSHGRR